MDLSKAFDTLSHWLVVAKLFAYGIELPACKLVCIIYINRRQRAKTGNARSDWLNIEKDVPQKSIPEPTLFNVFLNDIFFI